MTADVSFAFNLNCKFVMFLVRLYVITEALLFRFITKKKKKLWLGLLSNFRVLEVLLFLCFTSVPYGQYELEDPKDAKVN